MMHTTLLQHIENYARDQIKGSSLTDYTDHLTVPSIDRFHYSSHRVENSQRRGHPPVIGAFTLMRGDFALFVYLLGCEMAEYFCEIIL